MALWVHEGRVLVEGPPVASDPDDGDLDDPVAQEGRQTRRLHIENPEEGSVLSHPALPQARLTG